MKYLFRFLYLLLTQRRRSRVDPLAACVTPFRVLPNDLDIFMHMNNGAYLTIADLGRMDLLMRCDLFAPVRARNWYPVVAAQTIRFRRSLTLWQRYTITTRIVGWSDRSLYLEQVFERAGKRVAHALIDARFLERGGRRVGTDELMALTGVHHARPDLPEHVRRWVDSVQAGEGASASSSTAMASSDAAPGTPPPPSGQR